MSTRRRAVNFLVLMVTGICSATGVSAACPGFADFTVAPTYGVGTRPGAVASGDFNGDGKIDLAVANAMSNNISILLGNGDGTFAPAVNYAVGAVPESIAVSDFNSDGKSDLVVVNENSSNSGQLCCRLVPLFSPRKRF
jgi:hypothetical protein